MSRFGLHRFPAFTSQFLTPARRPLPASSLALVVVLGLGALANPARAEEGSTPPGADAYRRFCAACHGARAQGAVGPRLDGSPALDDTEAFLKIVSKGRNKMPAMDFVPPAQVSAVRDYLRKPKQGAAAPESK